MRGLILRPGLGFTTGAALGFAATAALVVASSTVARSVVVLTVGFAVVAWLVGLVLGMRLAVAAGTALCGLGATVDLATTDTDRWGAAIVMGLSIYGSFELGFEAIERRDGSVRSVTAWRAWVGARGAITVASAAIGLVAWAAHRDAPMRSLPLQAGLVLFVLGALAVLAQANRR